MDANRMNLRLASSFGVTAFLEENAYARLNVLEIGTGLGSLKNFIETRTNHLYTGVDVVARVPGVLEATADGLLPREVVEQRAASFSYVVSSNVFQHFSARQRSQYIVDAHALLHEGGLFIMNLSVDTGKMPSTMRDTKGNAWADHYGQYTPIPKGGAIYDELARSFAILYVTQRYDGLFNFVCQKKK
jgi:SAM-dependent methyltransferase